MATRRSSHFSNELRRLCLVVPILALPCLLAVQSNAAAGSSPQKVPRGGTLVVGLSEDIDTLNVYSTGFLGYAEAAVVEGLLAPDARAEYVPVLATVVPTLANGGILLEPDNRMQVTYHLRPGVLWQDGAPFTSADVKFTWEAVRDPAFLAESKDGSENIASIDTPDDLTVVVHYNRRSAAFASTLFTFGILPRHRLAGHDLNHDPYNERPIGTGPFMVHAFRRGEYLVLDRNPHYWRHGPGNEALPYLDRIVFRIIPDTNTLGILIRAGEIGLAPLVPYMLAEQIEGARGITVEKGPSLGWEHLDFNFRGPAPLRDISVRRAVASAIDRRALVRAAGGYPEPIHSAVVPLLAGLFDPAVQGEAYDPAGANRLLDSAGYRRDSNGVRAKNGHRLEFRITAQSGQVDDEIAEQVIIAQLQAIGIRLTADNKTGISFREARYRGDYDLLYGRWVTAADPVYSVFFGTHGPDNGQGYTNPALDAAMARMETSMQPEARREAAADMQRILAQDVPTIPLVSAVSLATKTVRLRNYVMNPTNMTDFVTAATWYLARPDQPRVASR